MLLYEKRKREQQPAPLPTMNPENNSIYNTFFRKLKIYRQFKTKYNEFKSQNPTKGVLIIRNFNPYFYMSFMKPNYETVIHIDQYYKFDEPFKIEVTNPSQYSNLIMAFVLHANEIKNIVRIGKDIYPKHLHITEEEFKLCRFRFVYDKQTSFQSLINSLRKNPLLIIDCTQTESTFKPRLERKCIYIPLIQ